MTKSRAEELASKYCDNLEMGACDNNHLVHLATKTYLAACKDIIEEIRKKAVFLSTYNINAIQLSDLEDLLKEK